jgi:hypothetical protein
MLGDAGCHFNPGRLPAAVWSWYCWRVPTYIFTGSLRPARVFMTIERQPPVQLFGDRGETIELDFLLVDSLLSVRWKGPLIDGRETSRNIVEAAIQRFLDPFCFLKGMPIEVEITTMAGEDEDPFVFPAQIGAIAQRHAELVRHYKELFNLLRDDRDDVVRPLRRALADFRLAMIEADDTPFFCFRAAEALMYCFGKNPRLGRPHLCRRLRIQDKWITEQLERPAGEIRHGKFPGVPERLRISCFHAASEPIVRFIELARSGLETLPSDGFPLLAPGTDYPLSEVRRSPILEEFGPC